MSTGPYRTADAPVVTPLSNDELVESAVAAVCAACRDLPPDDTRAVLLAVGALYGLGLAHVGSAEEDFGPRLTIDDVERLLKAARGPA